jgi:hypothetical protein
MDLDFCVVGMLKLTLSLSPMKLSSLLSLSAYYTAEKWTFDYLAECFGSVAFGVSRPTGGNAPMLMTEYVDYMKVCVNPSIIMYYKSQSMPVLLNCRLRCDLLLCSVKLKI